MNFSVDPQGQIVVVSTEVEKLDASNAPELKAHFLQLNKVGTNYIILDMSKTKYCDSSGLSAVLIANRLCKDTNCRFLEGWPRGGLHQANRFAGAQIFRVCGYNANNYASFVVIEVPACDVTICERGNAIKTRLRVHASYL